MSTLSRAWEVLANAPLRAPLRHLVFQDHELIWDSDHPFPQQNLLKFLQKQGECKCPFDWSCPNCGRVCSRCEELR